MRRTNALPSTAIAVDSKELTSEGALCPTFWLSVAIREFVLSHHHGVWPYGLCPALFQIAGYTLGTTSGSQFSGRRHRCRKVVERCVSLYTGICSSRGKARRWGLSLQRLCMLLTAYTVLFFWISTGRARVVASGASWTSLKLHGHAVWIEAVSGLFGQIMTRFFVEVIA